MNRKIVVSLFLAFSFFLCFQAGADPGVVIDAKGGVNVTEGGKTLPAKAGTKFADGAVINVAKGGSATLLFASGEIKKVAAGEKFTVAQGAAKGGSQSVIKGIALAYGDAGKASAGPTVHGMVKDAGGAEMEIKKDVELGAADSKQMGADISAVNAMGLSRDGKALMSAQVYYKYGQNQKVVAVLLPVYKAQKPPAEMVRDLLALAYDKMGNAKEAKKYR